ncbi:MAG: DUF3160 domain-containing protein [Desulfobacterales bacterium]|nr:DUF3160 domain-containing protein [Desulfobacterales bacterium]
MIFIWLILSMVLLPCGSCAVVSEARETEDKQRLHLSREALGLLEKNRFVVVPTAAYQDMNGAYEAFRKNNVPIFVTTDSVLHTAHLLFDYLLRTIEVHHLMGDLNRLTHSMIKSSFDDYEKAEQGEVKKAACANIAFFSVAARLLNQREAVPAAVKDIVEAEIGLIQKHEGFEESPVLGYLEDYSQYVPRGHYTRSREFKSYFKAMVWYGRMGFYLNPSTSLQITEELTRQLTRQALLIVRALSGSNVEGDRALAVWKRIYEPTCFFVGKTDDLSVYDYQDMALRIYRKIPGVNDLTDELRLEKFMSEVRKLQKPRILSTSVIDTENEKKSAEAITLGFRFMGQRFVPDSYMFQNLVYPKVMFYTGDSRPFTRVMSRRGPIRGFPRGLDVMAILGSKHAEDIIGEEGDGDYQRYDGQLQKLKKEFDLNEEQWSSSLYWNWLYCLKPLLVPFQGSVPRFMRSKAWAGKALHAALGSWAELRHDTILYAKQSCTMSAGGLPPQPQLTHGYVEPYPEAYARVRGIVERMRKGLALRGFLDGRIEAKLVRYEGILETLEIISRKELAGDALAESEYETIWNIGSALKSVTRFPPEIISGITSRTDDKMAVIADVHTDPNSKQVLEEAVGLPFIIYVKTPVNGKDQIFRGPVFSYYEFKQPMSDRLTDEQWQRMLMEGLAPSLPRWTGKFIGKQI